MGKKPFSAKAKREQLRKKRLEATGSSSVVPRNGNIQLSPSASQVAHTQPSTSAAPSTQVPPRGPRGRAPRGAHAYRYRLQLGDSEKNASKNTELAHALLSPISVLKSSVDDIRPYPDDRFAMPRRPAWRYDEAVDVVDRRETAALRAWRDRVVAGQDSPPFFEQNIETWRQLWRVIERSDVIVIVADIRYPALHFVPDLYYYVADDLGKGVVLALNKCDLVPKDVITAWRSYFMERFPRLSVAMFSSFPDAKLVPSKHNSELLSKRERRMARSKLSAWGADKLLEAIESLDLDARKMTFLEDWRRQKHVGMSDDDEDEDENSGSIAFTSKTYEYGDEDAFLQSQSSAIKCNSSQARTPPKRRRNNISEETNNENKPIPTGSQATDEESAKETEFVSSSGNNKFLCENAASDNDGDAIGDADHMITIGIVGHPNAGKSSLINGIFRKKVVSTSKTPGHTKHLQTIFLTDSVKLCDCPGLVFPGLAPRELQIIAGMFPISQVREPLSVVKYLAERVRLVEILKLDSEVGKLEDFLLESDYVAKGWTAWKICEAWAMKRGYRTAKAARLDVPRAANHILRLALEGRIVLSTVPPGFSPASREVDQVSSVLQSDWSDSSFAYGTHDEDSEFDGRYLVRSIRHGGESHYDASSLNDNQSFSDADGEESGAKSDTQSDAESDETDDDDDNDGAPSQKLGAVANAFALLDEECE